MRALWSANGTSVAQKSAWYLEYQYNYCVWAETKIVDDDSDTESWCSDTEDDEDNIKGAQCDMEEDGMLVDLYILSSDVMLTDCVSNVGGTDTKNRHACIFDSGCSRHMTPNQSIFKSPPESCAPKTFHTANKNTFTVTRKGTAKIDVQGPAPLVLPNVLLYIPELANTLVLISCPDEAGYRVTFGEGQGVITNERGDVIGTIPKSNGLYRLVDRVEEEANAVVERITLNDLHRCMGHISVQATMSSPRQICRGHCTHSTRREHRTVQVLYFC